MNKKVKFIFSIIFSVIILAILFIKFDLSKLDLSKIKPSLIIIPFIFYFFIKLINTVRYSNVYKIPNKPKLFWILCYSNLMLSLIPFRLGEFSYISNFKREFNKTYKEAAQKLILIRFIDYVAIYILLLISSIYVSTQIKDGLIGIISLFFVISLIIFFGFVYIVGFTKSNFGIKSKKLNKIILVIKEGFREMLKISKLDFFKLFFLTFMYWGIRLVMGYLILILLGIKISFYSAVFISLLLLLLGLFPIQTYMNFGTFEAGWVYFLINLGYEYSQILPMILIYHITLMIPPIIYGILGFFFKGR